MKSTSVEALTSFRYNPDDPNAISYKVDSEEVFQKKYPWNYTDHLIPKLKERYRNFKINRDFHTLRSKIEKNKRFSAERHLDLSNLKGTKKRFYSTNILKEFDKHYTKK